MANPIVMFESNDEESIADLDWPDDWPVPRVGDMVQTSAGFGVTVDKVLWFLDDWSVRVHVVTSY